MTYRLRWILGMAMVGGLSGFGGGALAQGNGIIRSGPLGHGVVNSGIGTSMNMVTSRFDDTGPFGPGWDFNFWNNGIGFSFYATDPEHPAAFVLDADGKVAVLHPGDAIGPDANFSDMNPLSAVQWLAGVDAYAGVRFPCDGRLAHPVSGGQCYGYLHVTTTGPNGFPGTIVDTGFDGDGDPITIPAAGNGIVRWKGLDHAVMDTKFGTEMNLLTGEFDDTASTYDDDWLLAGFLFYGGFMNPQNPDVLGFTALSGAFVMDMVDGAEGPYRAVAALHPGDVVGPDVALWAYGVSAVPEWLAGSDAYVGVQFPCDGLLPRPVPGGICYGYVHLRTTGATGFPATILDAAFDGDGNPIAIPEGGGGGAANGIIDVGVNHPVRRHHGGTSLNVVTGAYDDNGSIGGDYDVNIGYGTVIQGWPLNAHRAAVAVDANGQMLALHNGDTIGPDTRFQDFLAGPVREWENGTEAALGIRFDCDGRLPNPVAGGICYGYVRLRSIGTTGYPALILGTTFNGDGDPITVSGLGSLPPPQATVAAGTLALSLIAGEKEIAESRIDIANAEGSQLLSYAITFASGSDCAGAPADWLSASPASGVVGGDGVHAAVTVIADGTTNSPPVGSYPIMACIATNDADHALIAIPITLTVTAGSSTSVCPASVGDGVFCDGFDGRDSSAVVPGVYNDRTGFLGGVAADYYENGFDELGESTEQEPARRYDDPDSGIAYTVDSSPNPDSLWFYPGVMSVSNSVARIVVSFDGMPVTAVGGNFYGIDGGSGTPLAGSLVTIKLTLSDGTARTFFTTADAGDFHGYTSALPIVSVTVTTPVPENQPLDLNWAAIDDLIVGRTR